MTELKKRVLSAMLLGPAVAIIFGLTSPPLFLLFLCIVLLAAIFEFLTLLNAGPRPLLLLLSAASIVPLYAGSPQGFILWLLLSSALYLALALATGSGDENLSNRTGRGLTALLLSEVFLVLPIFFLFRLKEAGNLLPLVLLFTIWASDTAAYLVGKRFGKHKLVPRVSPGKTVEGLAGAALGSALVTVLFRGTMAMGLVEAAAVGVVIGILGQAGDILESVGKRVAGAKDSSSIIPGHGGILDRMDSLIFTSPFIYHYITGLKG